MADINFDTMNTLAEKVDSLDLTDGEQAVLDQVLARAAASESDVEVEGFAFERDDSNGLKSPEILASMGNADIWFVVGGTAFKFGAALGMEPPIRD